MKPVIGITLGIEQRPAGEYLHLRRRYVQAVVAAGGVPVLVGPDAQPEEVVRICQGLVLSGGGNLPPGVVDPEHPERVAAERRLIDAFCDRGRPILGVCYGMQLINLHFGGTLVADVREIQRSPLDHRSEHPIQVEPGSEFFGHLTSSTVVSSRHRQAVRDVAPGFRVAAVAPDGVVEAIERGGVVGVEWHPEADLTAAAVYGALISQCDVTTAR